MLRCRHVVDAGICRESSKESSCKCDVRAGCYGSVYETPNKFLIALRFSCLLLLQKPGIKTFSFFERSGNSV